MSALQSRAFLATFTLLAACADSDDKRGDAAPSTVTRGVIPDRAVFVVNGGDATVSIVDQSKDGVVSSIELHGVEYPHHVNLDKSGDRMLIAVPGIDLSGGHGKHESNEKPKKNDPKGGTRGMVLMLDARSGQLLDFHRLAGINHNAAFGANDTEVWTTESNANNGRVVVLSAQDLEPIARIEVGKSPLEVTFSLDGARAFVCNSDDGTVSVIDVANKSLISEVAVGEMPVGAWPASDGMMYVDNEGSKSLSALDSSTLMVTRTYELGFMPGMAALAPTHELWVTDADTGRVVIFDTAATDDVPVRTISVGDGAHGIAFSTDKMRAYVTNQDDDTVSVIDVAGSTVLDTLAVGHKPNGLIVRAQ